MAKNNPLDLLTPFEICSLRLKCIELNLLVANKADLSRESYMPLAEQAWSFMIKILEQKAKETTAK